MPIPLTIRRGTIEDAERISAFVTALSQEYIVGEFSAKGRGNFLQDHTPSAMQQRLAGDFRFYLAYSGDELAGVAAIRSNKHLYYLFIAQAFQRSGLARRLWAQVRADSLALGNPGDFTVNASNYAVAAYEKLGFRRTESTKETNGVLYNPMRFVG